MFNRATILFVSVIAVLTVGDTHTIGAEMDYSAYVRVLATFVDEKGNVDYAALAGNGRDLRIFTTLLSNLSPHSHPDSFKQASSRLAYWINAYNALVLKGVVVAYPVDSVKDIKEQMGFFSQTYYAVGGERLSLNDIEHKILRKVFDEPRIHAAINCASVACPPLSRNVYRSEDLDAQLETAMRTFVAEKVRLDRENRTVVLSKIFDWFGGDFTGWYKRKKGVDNAHILDYIGLYLELDGRSFVSGAQRPSVRYEAYDWKLNDQHPDREG